MYTLTLEFKKQKKNYSYRFKDLNELICECPRYENIESFSLAPVFDKLDDNICILKPLKNNDFLFLYSSNTFFNEYIPNLGDYLKGRLLSEVFRFNPLYEKLNDNQTTIKLDIEFDLQLLINEKLLKFYKVSFFKQNEYYYLIFRDKTKIYQEKKRSNRVFEEAYIPRLQINNDYQIIKSNQAFKEKIGYSITELNKKGIDNIVKTIHNNPKGLTSFIDNFSAIFKSEIENSNLECEILTKDGDNLWFNTYIRQIDDNLIQIGFHYIKKIKETGDTDLSFLDNFMNKQKGYKTAISIREGNTVKWTPEIYEILEINQNNVDLNSNDNFIYYYTLPGEDEKIQTIIDNLSDNQIEKCIYGIKTAKGNIKYLKSLFSVQYINNKRNIYTFTQDITDEVKSEQNALKLQENFELIQDTSKIGLTTYEKGKYSYTPEIYKIFGITPNEYPDTVSLMHEFLVPEDKNKLVEVFDLSTSKPTSEVTYRIISQDNTLKYIYSQNKAIFNKYGQVIRKIGFIMDVTEETLAKNEAFELQDNINQIQSLSKIFITTYKDGNFTYTDEAYNLCETTKEETASNDLINVVVPEDLKKIFKLVNSVSYENPNFQIKYRILTAKGNNRIFSCKATGKFDDKHELIKIVGFIQDVTETVEYEETLKQLSEDRKVLLQEVHHRVKNNLQLILSFLNLESRFNKNNPEYVLNQAYNRIHTMALTHEEVYNSDSLSNVNLKTFLEDAINNLFNLYSKGNIKLHLDIEPIEIDMDRSIPLGLLVNEVSLNTIKYAFPNEVEGNYYITIKNIDGILDLKIWDDGVGLANGVDLFTAVSLGFIIIRNFTQQLDANLTQLSNVKGFGLELKFKI